MSAKQIHPKKTNQKRKCSGLSFIKWVRIQLHKCSWILITSAWKVNNFINLQHSLYVQLFKLGIIRKAVWQKHWDDRWNFQKGKSMLTYRQGQKVLHSYSPQRASLPLKRSKAGHRIIMFLWNGSVLRAEDWTHLLGRSRPGSRSALSQSAVGVSASWKPCGSPPSPFP